MPSQEDYLDRLLRSIGAETLKEDEQPEEVSVNLDEIIPEQEVEAAETEPDRLEFEEDAINLDAILPALEAEAAESEMVLPKEEDTSAINAEEAIAETESSLSEFDVDSILSEDSVAIDALSEGDVIDSDVPEGSAETDALLEAAIADLEQSEAFEDMGVLSKENDGIDALLGDIVVEQTPELEMEDVSNLEDILDSDDGLVLGDGLSEDDGLSKDEEYFDASPDLDALSSMSEDDIERILSAGAEEMKETSDEEEASEDDVLGMLKDAEDGDLQEIAQLLDRADNNEAVDEEIIALLQEPPQEENLEEKLFEENDTKDAKTLKAQERERRRQEKAAARKAAKEAKAAAKAAAKETKASGKATIETTAENIPVPTADEGISDVKIPDSEEQTMNAEDLFDTAILDSIVSEADQAETEVQRRSDKSGEEDILRNSDFFGEGDTVEVMGSEDKSAGKENSNDGLGFDLGSLFGDSDDSGLGADAVDPSELADFPDFVEPAGDDADNSASGMDEGGNKKRGLLAKFFDFLTEEDEEEESEALQLSDENREILNDLDKEKTTGKKKKKGKKKGKKAAAAEGEEEGKAKGKGKGKPKKEKKPKAPKPEKPKKEKKIEPEPLIPERKLTLKRMLPVILVCASLAVLIIVFTNASVEFMDKKTAHEAYYSGDYQTCYQNLYGKNLNETEQIMFGTSESVMRVRLWLSEYELFANAGDELGALEVLILSVRDYPKLYAYAVQWNAGGEVQVDYQKILDILAQKYGLTESQALEIANTRSDIEYTRMVLFIVEGRGFGSWNEKETTVNTPSNSEADSRPDVLPEEDELNGNGFIDNRR